ERLRLQKIIDQKRSQVQGTVKLKIYKGNVSIVSRISNKSIYSMKNVSFEENKTFNKKRVENFIKKNARLLRR
ncbi:MAG: argininosuccinate synthase, partial [Candidatus Fonsibacter ubiquis]